MVLRLKQESRFFPTFISKEDSMFHTQSAGCLTLSQLDV